ncbi:hypothetical protein Dimus_037175, partial [Dionaea muscipula]
NRKTSEGRGELREEKWYRLHPSDRRASSRNSCHSPRLDLAASLRLLDHRDPTESVGWIVSCHALAVLCLPERMPRPDLSPFEEDCLPEDVVSSSGSESDLGEEDGRTTASACLWGDLCSQLGRDCYG